jgi:hypothetical protein
LSETVSLNPGDILVLYQHQTNRDGSDWIEPEKLQFEESLHVRKDAAKLACAPGIARDVAFFYIEKKSE